MMDNYDISDFREAILGAFVSVLLFFAVRAGEPFNPLNPVVAGAITIAWLYVVYTSFKVRPDGQHFFINVVVVFAFCTGLSLAFQLTTWEAFKANPIGSPAMIAMWMALPVSLLFDKHNISSVLSRYYVRGVESKIDKRDKKRKGKIF